MKYFAASQGPFTLSAKTSSKSASSTSMAIFDGPTIPAAATSSSTGPRVSRATRAACSTSAGFVASPTTVTDPGQSAAVCAKPVSSRSNSRIPAPSLARPTALARPSAPAAPVTAAIFPTKRSFMVFSTQVEFLQLFHRDAIADGTFIGDLAAANDIDVVGDIQCHADVLLDQQQRQAQFT